MEEIREEPNYPQDIVRELRELNFILRTFLTFALEKDYKGESKAMSEEVKAIVKKLNRGK